LSTYEGNVQLRLFCSEAQRQIDDLQIWRRNIYRYPFDHLADQFLSKAFGLAGSISHLTDAGFNDEAYGLSRSLVEAAVNLRYITAKMDEIQSRTWKFVQFSRTDKNLWMYWTLRKHAGQPTEQTIRELADREGYVEDGLSAYHHWSEIRDFVRMATEIPHPRDPKDAEMDDRKMQRVNDYYYTSCFVHCSQPGLDNYFDVDSRMVKIHPAKLSSLDIAKRAVRTTNQYLKAVISYCLHGMNVEVPLSFDCLTRLRFDIDRQEYKMHPRG
jgi:Family of unknown function (DUF5677)